MATWYCVYENATGDALRAGYSDQNPGAGETQRTDAPIPTKVKYNEDDANMHRWNGSAWVEVTNATPPP